jgi:hypothetical protein
VEEEDGAAVRGGLGGDEGLRDTAALGEQGDGTGPGFAGDEPVDRDVDAGSEEYFG